MLLRTLSRRGAPLLLGARARAAGLSILAGEVRGLQAPLKEKYAADAGSALIEMKAEGYINNENMTTTIQHDAAGHWISLAIGPKLVMFSDLLCQGPFVNTQSQPPASK